MIVVILLASFLTYLTTIMAGVVILTSSWKEPGAAAVNVLMVGCALCVVLLASLVNPVIYCW